MHSSSFLILGDFNSPYNNKFNAYLNAYLFQDQNFFR